MSWCKNELISIYQKNLKLINTKALPELYIRDYILQRNVQSKNQLSKWANFSVMHKGKMQLLINSRNKYILCPRRNRITEIFSSET